MGIDIDRLENDCKDFINCLTCQICHGILLDTKIAQCDHYFCNPCISKWLEENDTCPECRKPITANGFISSSIFMKRAFESLKIKCQYHDCDMVSSYYDFEGRENILQKILPHPEFSRELAWNDQFSKTLSAFNFL